MIIDERIDKVLWLMLVSDYENRDSIVNCVSNIPYGLKKQIINGLDKLGEYKKTGIKNFTFLCGEYHINNMFLYNFDINTDDNEINIELMVSDGNIYRDVFKINLYLGNNLENRKLFKKNRIGKIEYNIDTRIDDGVMKVVSFSKCEYSLTKTLLGDIISICYDDMDVRSNYIDLNSYRELILDDINNNDFDKNLVRKRKKVDISKLEDNR